MAKEQKENRWSSRLEWFQMPFQQPMEQFRMDAVNIQTTQEKFQTDAASHLIGLTKILHRSCQLFERLHKNFERMMLAVWMAW